MLRRRVVLRRPWKNWISSFRSRHFILWLSRSLSGAAVSCAKTSSFVIFWLHFEQTSENPRGPANKFAFQLRPRPLLFHNSNSQRQRADDRDLDFEEKKRVNSSLDKFLRKKKIYPLRWVSFIRFRLFARLVYPTPPARPTAGVIGTKFCYFYRPRNSSRICI